MLRCHFCIQVSSCSDDSQVVSNDEFAHKAVFFTLHSILKLNLNFTKKLCYVEGDGAFGHLFQKVKKNKKQTTPIQEGLHCRGLKAVYRYFLVSKICKKKNTNILPQITVPNESWFSRYLV